MNKANIYTKQGVAGDLHPIAAKALERTAVFFGDHGDSTLYLTSIKDGNRDSVTLHPYGYAFDIGLPFNFNIYDVFNNFKKHVGPGFDVVIESDHIHIEYDPKKNMSLEFLWFDFGENIIAMKLPDDFADRHSFKQGKVHCDLSEIVDELE